MELIRSWYGAGMERGGFESRVVLALPPGLRHGLIFFYALFRWERIYIKSFLLPLLTLNYVT